MVHKSKTKPKKERKREREITKGEINRVLFLTYWNAVELHGSVYHIRKYNTEQTTDGIKWIEIIKIPEWCGNIMHK